MRETRRHAHAKTHPRGAREINHYHRIVRLSFCNGVGVRICAQSNAALKARQVQFLVRRPVSHPVRCSLLLAWSSKLRSACSWRQISKLVWPWRCSCAGSSRSSVAVARATRSRRRHAGLDQPSENSWCGQLVSIRVRGGVLFGARRRVLIKSTMGGAFESA